MVFIGTGYLAFTSFLKTSLNAKWTFTLREMQKINVHNQSNILIVHFPFLLIAV